MGAALKVVNMGRAARMASQLKVRQPLDVVVVAVDGKRQAALSSLADVVLDELNVKRLDFADSAADLVTYSIKPNYRTLGPRFGKSMPDLAKAVAGLESGTVVKRLEADLPIKVDVQGTTHELHKDDLVVEVVQRAGFAVEKEGDVVVGLSTTLTPELAREGLARELVHHVQNTRKAAGFQIEDRIDIWVEGPEPVAEMLSQFEEYVRRETLGVCLSWDTETMPADGAYREELRVNGLPVVLAVKRAGQA